jgi:hypothetical protein
MRELLQLPYSGPDIAILPPRGEPVAVTRRTAVGPVLAFDNAIAQRKVCAVKPWHGEHGTDPHALLVREAMRRQAALRPHKRELG